MIVLAEKTGKKSKAEASNLEKHFSLARPRLVRIAQRYRVLPDAVDDVVQETLLYAWFHIDQLYTLDVFDRWLDGICRNLCLRWRRAQSIRSLQEIRISAKFQDDDIELELADLSQPDPLEELERQDLQALLECALGHLPETARAVLELCYLEEMPQCEAASQLGLSVNALEVRLHRARHRLRDILQTELRDEAENFGLLIDDKAQRWYQTRLWCGLCGKQRLRGCFETMADGRINLRVCCPNCSHDGSNLLCTLGRNAISSQRSFMQTLQQVGSEIYQCHSSMVAGICPYCHARGQIYSVASGDIPETSLRFPPHLLKCLACGEMSALAVADYARASNSVVQDFSAQHPRAILIAQEEIFYDRLSAIRFSLAEINSASQLTVTVDSKTLNVLALS